MEKEYLDTPLEVEAWLETLSDKERAMFDKGFVIALLGVLEQFIETKTTLANAAMGATSKHHYNQLLSKIELIDAYEAHYQKRVKMCDVATI